MIMILFIFVTTFFVLNVMVTILISNYKQEATKKYHLDEFSKESKIWVSVQSFMIIAYPNVIP